LIKNFIQKQKKEKRMNWSKLLNHRVFVQIEESIMRQYMLIDTTISEQLLKEYERDEEYMTIEEVVQKYGYIID